MSKFTELLDADLSRVFLDVDTFGELYEVEGKEIPIVLDSDELKARQGGQELAIADSATLFYARVRDLPRRRPAGEILNINGRECKIDDWREDMGMATITLRQNIVG